MLPEEALAEIDVVRLNLLVARIVDPGIDIDRFDEAVDRMAAHIRWQIDINEQLFEDHKEEYEG